MVVVVWVLLGMKGDLVCDKGRRTRRQARMLQSEYRGRTHVVFITIEPTIVHHPSILQTTSLLVAVTSERNVGLHLQHLTLRDPTRRHVIQPHYIRSRGSNNSVPRSSRNDQRPGLLIHFLLSPHHTSIRMTFLFRRTTSTLLLGPPRIHNQIRKMSATPYQTVSTDRKSSFDVYHSSGLFGSC